MTDSPWLGTDSAEWFATDVNLIGNTQVPAYEVRENYGWSSLVDLMHPERSLPALPDHGELPLHTFFSPELTQRNFYWGEPWQSFDDRAQKMSLVQQLHGGYDGLESVLWTHGPSAGASTQSALIASYDLGEMPSLAGQAIYMALRWKPAVPGSALSLLIDDGGGRWQYSNATGLICNQHIVAACHAASGTAAPAAVGSWRLRVYAATMKPNGTARFALRLTVPAVDDGGGSSGSVLAGAKVSGIVIAPIGARYRSVAGLKSDDDAGLASASRRRTSAAPDKRGLSGLQRCGDAHALGLGASWHYNWGLWPTQIDAGGNRAPAGTKLCSPPMAAEFVPQFWGYWGNGSIQHGLWDGFKDDWAAIGVKAIMGFNEPDNIGQSDLTPKQAALGYIEIDQVAQQFDPPLIIVGPGMTHWDDAGGSVWLDQFLANLSAPLAARIRYLGQHDYSGDAAGIVAKADKAYEKYKKRVWLSEFSVGFGKDRATNNQFMKKVLPLLDAADSVARYAWYSTRNAPGAWVNASNLLPADDNASWAKQSGMACTANGMIWVNSHVNAMECQTQVLDDVRCAKPKTAVYQSGSPKNCYCAKSVCNQTHTGWQDTCV